MDCSALTYSTYMFVLVGSACHYIAVTHHVLPGAYASKRQIANVNCHCYRRAVHQRMNDWRRWAPRARCRQQMRRESTSKHSLAASIASSRLGTSVCRYRWLCCGPCSWPLGLPNISSAFSAGPNTLPISASPDWAPAKFQPGFLLLQRHLDTIGPTSKSRNAKRALRCHWLADWWSTGPTASVCL